MHAGGAAIGLNYNSSLEPSEADWTREVQQCEVPLLMWWWYVGLATES